MIGDRTTVLGWHHPTAKWEVREASQVPLLTFVIGSIVIKIILGEVIKFMKIIFRFR